MASHEVGQVAGHELQDSASYALWLNELPSPLALPLARVRPRLEDNDISGAIWAGLDALMAGYKWVCFVGIADVFQKLRDDHPFATRDRLAVLFPAIRRVFQPNTQPQHWQECLAALTVAYRNHPELFVVPAFIVDLANNDGSLVKDVTAIRQLFDAKPKISPNASGLSSPQSVSDAATLAKLWEELSKVLVEVFGHFTPFTHMRLVQWNSLFESSGESRYQTARHLLLRGYRLEEEDLRGGMLEIVSNIAPQMRQLMLFDSKFQRGISLHPYLLFSPASPNKTGATFFFQTIKRGALSFESLSGTENLELSLEHAADEESALDLNDTARSTNTGPIFQYFSELRLLLQDNKADAFSVLPAFSRPSNLLNFQRTIDFHAEAFSGRTEYFERIDHAIAGPFRCVLITGLAGYGKSALMSRLAQQHVGSVVYFITPERGAADGSRFLAHMCQSIIDRFHFADVLNDEVLGDLAALKALFAELLIRANDSLETGKLVLLIDGLDESVRYASRPEECIETCLPQNRDQIPERIVFILTSRPGEASVAHLADLRLDLAPFSREQIGTILAKQGWNREAAEVAYGKSDGQPIYFRFLLDSIKRGEVGPADADRLPTGIVAFYEHFWRQCEVPQEASDKPSGHLLQHLLGFLAAACEPLTQIDLLELVGGVLGNISDVDIRQAFAKEYLGRFVIGSRRYSLFHDTLREFVLKMTRPVNDFAAYGEAKRYHHMLAMWCRQTSNVEYGDAYLVYHLLHARLPSEALATMEDASPNGPFRRRMGDRHGTTKLVRELRYATSAARELNSLDRIFCLTLLQISMNKLKNTAALPEALPVLFGLGLTEDLMRLIEGCDKEDDRWNTASSVFVLAISEGDERRIDAFFPVLQKIWFGAQSYRKSTLLELLLAKFRSPTEAHIRRVLDLFPDSEKTQLPRNLAIGLRQSPAVAGRLIAAQDLRKSSSWYVSNELIEVVYDLIVSANVEDQELGWRLFAVVDFNQLVSGLVYARAIIQQAPARATEIVSNCQLLVTEWSQLKCAISILRILRTAASEQFEHYLAGQGPDIAVLGLCLVANEPLGSRTEQDAIRHYQLAAERFQAECSAMASVGALACLTLLHIAESQIAFDELQARKLSSGEALSPGQWDYVLTQLILVIESATGSVEVSSTEVETELRGLLPSATATLREIAPLFEGVGGKGALWFALAVAAGGLEVLASSHLADWLRKRQAGERDGSRFEPAKRIVSAITPRLSQYLQYRRGRQALHAILLPVVTTLVSQKDYADRLRKMTPLAASEEAAIAVLSPTFFLEKESLSPLLPWLVTDGGYVMGIDQITGGALLQYALTNPIDAYSKFPSIVECDGEVVIRQRQTLALDAHKADVPSSEELTEGSHRQAVIHDQNFQPWKSTPVIAEGLATILLLDGYVVEGFDIIKQEKAGSAGWPLFARYGVKHFREFLDELPEIMDKEAYATDLFRVALTDILDRVGPERDVYVKSLLVESKLLLEVRLELCRYAFRHNQANLAQEMLLSLAESEPDTIKAHLPTLVLPWIEATLRKTPELAAKMWELLSAFLASRSLEFLGEIQTSFDTKISVLLARYELTPRILEQLDGLHAPGFEQSTAAIASAVVKAGWAPSAVTSWVVFDGLNQVCKLLELIGKVPGPDWFVERCFDTFQRYVGKLSFDTSDVWYAFQLLAYSDWSEIQRAALFELTERKLKDAEMEADAKRGTVGEDAEDVARWQLLLVALRDKSFTALGIAAAEPEAEAILPDRIAYLAAVSPEVSWQIFLAVPNPEIRAAHVVAIFKAWLRRDVTVAVSTFRSFVNERNAHDIAFACLEAVRADQWPAIDSFFKQALAKIPMGSLDIYEATAMLRIPTDIDVHSHAIVVPILNKVRDPLAWLDYFAPAEGGPNDAAFLVIAEAELPRWSEQIRAMTEPGMTAWGVSSKLVALVQRIGRLADDLRKAEIFQRFFPSMTTVLDVRKADREAILNELLKVVATVDPDRALEWISRFEYRAYSLREALSVIVSRVPAKIEFIAREVLRGMDEWTRKNQLVACVTQLPLPTAVQWLTREKLDTNEFAMTFAKSQILDAEGMAQLMDVVGEDLDGRFALCLRALRRVGGVCDDTHRAWRDFAFSVFQRGKFVADQYDQIVFRTEDLKLFTAYEPELYAILFALLPDKMEESFTLQVRQAKPELQSQLQVRFDEIRAQAIPFLFRMSPMWILKCFREWSSRAFWPYLSEELYLVLRTLPSEDALKVVSGFTTFERRHLEGILEAVSTHAQMHECLEVLITEVLVYAPDKLDMVLDIVLAYLPKAGLEPLTALATWATQFVKAKTLLGVQASEVGEYLALLRVAAEGKEDQVKAAIGTKDESSHELSEIEATIRTLRKHGQDATMFENLRKRYLN